MCIKAVSFILICLSFGLLSFVVADDTGPVINCVAQNPKYFPDSRCYFRVTGMKDADLQRRVNDTLQEWLYWKTGYFQDSKTSSPDFKDSVIAPGEALWFYTKSCSSKKKIGGVIFRDADSVHALGRSGSQGAGASVCGWDATIYENKLVAITVEYDKDFTGDTLSANPIFISLNSGRCVTPSAKLVFPRSRQDSLLAFLNRSIADSFISQYGYKSAKVKSTVPKKPMALDRWDLHYYFLTGDVSVPIPFTLDGVASDGEKVHLDQTQDFKVSELAPYTDSSYYRDLHPLAW